MNQQKGTAVARLFDSYHPERHYMRGPGPRCLERQGDAGVSLKVRHGIFLSALKARLHLKNWTIWVAHDSPHDLSTTKVPRSGWIAMMRPARGLWSSTRGVYLCGSS